MKWISREGLASELQVTPDTLRGWSDRHWTKGVHYIVVGKTTLIDRDEVAKWLESRKVSNSAADRYGSISDGKAKGSRRLIPESATANI